VDEVVIGRGERRAVSREETFGVRRLIVSVPGRSTSTTHARLLRRGNDWTLEDCASTNGSFVNGARVARASLDDGDLLSLGRTLFVFRKGIPVSAETAADVDSTEFSGGVPGLATLVPSRARALTRLSRIAASTLPVLLIGESGTGKEVMARALHATSGRRGKLVAVNCGALTATLLESQLFGHVRGAFSGAVRDEPGLVRAADGGTLLLDEVGDLPLASQASLLRVVQEREVLPVGGVRPSKVDVRIIAATHRPLDRLASRGEFRADLLARLDGFTYALPPLRERREDLGLLVAELLAAAPPGADVRFTPEAGRALFAYDWPLNVRELQQALARGVVLSERGVIDCPHLPAAVVRALEGPARIPAEDTATDGATDATMRAQLVSLLQDHGGNVSEVARAMGKARIQIHRWAKRWNVNLESYRR
jgi:transcriptional regulator with GAF, ATPase, and Fis domain